MDDDDEVIKLADRIVHENISVHELEDISKKDDIKKRMPINKRINNNNYNYSQVEDELKDILGTNVKINGKKISIYFENVNDLNRILDIMNIDIK